MLQYKEYYMPKSIDELMQVIKENDSAEIISGGTDLYAEEREPLDDNKIAVDISKIKEFSIIESNNETITFGASTTVQQFIEEAVLVQDVPIMRHAASYFADQQIREMATVGGNIANSSPTGDMIPPLLAMGAKIHTIKCIDDDICEDMTLIEDFIKGVGKNTLSYGEVILSVTCPNVSDYGCAFKKVGLRRSLCISTVSSAFLVKVDKTKNVFEDVRIAFGGISPIPVRLREVEKRLIGSSVTYQVVQEMLKHIPEDIVQSRSRREYRKTIVRNFLLAGLLEALAEIDIVFE
ncbi:MAG: FAD binding domain-containing protein [Suipraeoptans sp.]